MARPETNREPVSLAYTPLYVTPLFSTTHPAPSTSDTALYALTAAPLCLMEVGVRVHLHFLYAASIVIADAPHQRPGPMSVPLAIRGWIAGERMRSGGEVEYVVKNEDAGARVRRAFVRCHVASGAKAPLPRLGELVALRFPGVPTGTSRAKDVESRRNWPARSKPYKPARPSLLARAPTTGGPTLESQVQMFDFPPLLTIANDVSRAQEPPRAGAVATQPYNIWETYGWNPNRASYATQAEAYAIRNYGCPIIVGPRARGGEQHLAFAQGWQVSETTPEMQTEGWTQATRRQEKS